MYLVQVYLGNGKQKRIARVETLEEAIAIRDKYLEENPIQHKEWNTSTSKVIGQLLDQFGEEAVKTSLKELINPIPHKKPYESPGTSKVYFRENPCKEVVSKEPAIVGKPLTLESEPSETETSDPDDLYKEAKLKDKASGIMIGGVSFSDVNDINTTRKPPKKLTPGEEADVTRVRAPYKWEGEAPENILVLADIHFPYHHKDALRFIEAVVDVIEPDVVVNVGDEVDSHSLSFYPMHPALSNATLELKYARQCLADLDSILPDVPILCCESNHTSRMYRKGKSAGIPKELILPYEEALGVDWIWRKDIVLPLPNGTECLFTHTKGSNTLMAGQSSGMNIVAGHYHKRGSVMYWTSHTRQAYFAAQVPCLIDFDSPAYSYDENSTNRPNLGVMVITQGIPHIITMYTDSDGNWDGNILGFPYDSF